MTQQIVSAAPLIVPLGTQDLSTRTVPIAPEQLPQHLPKFYIFAKRGSGANLVDGPTAKRIFGDETFDPLSKYFNHQTLFANEALGLANSCIIQRVIPPDAGPKSNAVMSLDVLVTTVDRYQRNSDGSIALDNFGNPTVIGTTPGLKVKWVKTSRTTVVSQQTIGDLTIGTGDQVDSSTNTHSTLYPIFEVTETDYGADGNNTGFRLWAATTSGGNSLPTALMAKYNAYPFMFSLISRVDSSTSPKPVSDIRGETQFLFTFKKDVVNPTTSQQVGYDKVIVDAYNLIDVPNYPNVYGRISNFYVYDANVATIQNLIYQYETPFIGPSTDITNDPATAGLVNFVTGTSSQNVPYESLIYVDSPTSVRLSQYSNVFLANGSDGTMSNSNFEQLVSDELERYNDPSDQVQDIARNVESIFYDSGFSLPLKLKIPNFIGIRKDTFVVLGTHTVGEPANTESEENSIAISLRTALQNYPESDYFGTPVTRGMIMGRSGLVRNSQYTSRVPGTFEILSKFSTYMGSGNGAWKAGSSPEGNPGNIINRLKNINITWVPNLVRNLNWDLGLNWVQTSDRARYIIPAYKTVYNNDTSVLNTALVALAIGQLNKVAYKTWLKFVGRSDLTGPQLVDNINSDISAQVAGKFDNRFTIIPAATLTDLDKIRGYSVTLPIKIGAKNSVTVMTTYVQAYRESDLVPNTNATTGG